MGAYNYLHFSHRCPSCGQTAEIAAQTHVAASFGGAGMRYYLHDYKLGDKMHWWPKHYRDYTDWREGGEPELMTDDGTVEYAYADCMSCKAELYAIISYRDLVPISVEEVGLVKDMLVSHAS